MTRENYAMCVAFFVLGCMILSAITHLTYVCGKMRVVLVKPSDSDSNVLEGDFSPSPTPNKDNEHG